MKKLYASAVLMLFFGQTNFAQVNKNGSNSFADNSSTIENTQTVETAGNAERISHAALINRKIAGLNQPTNLFAPSTGTEYDVKYYKLQLRINPDSARGIKGVVTTYFTTNQANFSIISFDMATGLVQDSVYYHGVKLAAGSINRTTADLIKISLPTIPTIGTLDSVTIYYKGVPPTVAAFSGGTGFVKSTHITGGVTKNYVYTLSEPYSSYTWWPCKSFVVNDKADSMDMIISTPLAFRSASNGTRVSEITSGSNVITYWKERYPVPAYLVCLAVANYVQYPTTPTMVNIGGTIMPYYNLIFPETNTAAGQTALDRVPLMLTTYSSLFSDYPFKNEKYGNYTFGFSGGMEHTTFSGESSSGVYQTATNWDILAHELGHQWWGDNVTCASWKDIWLNESFADYSEALLLEFAPSIATSVGTNAVAWRNTKKTNSISASFQAKTTYVLDTTDITTIFTPSVYIYDRGGMVITMLRTLMGDAKFFQALKNYQTDPLLAQGNAFTADMKRHMEATSGLNLTTFFNQWIYNTGYAKYSGIAGSICEWNNSGTNVIIKLAQKSQSSALTRFDLPVPVRLQGAGGQDTTVIIYDINGILHYDNNGVLTSSGGNTVQYALSFVPTTITFDAFNQTMATGTFTKNTGVILATNLLSFAGSKEGNTTKLFWSIDNSSEYSAFEVEKSTDGISFNKIGTLFSKELPNQLNFLFTDNKNSNVTSYYRLKVVQKDGSNLYSKIIPISNAINNYYTITPNPATDFIEIKCKGFRDVVSVKVFDASGNQVKALANQSFISTNGIKIPLQDVSPGNYFVEVYAAFTGKFTKQIVVIK
jgi:Peptidase family M1 domain/Secretion system C-terminal sorting domain